MSTTPPPRVRPGDRLAVVAPAGAFDPAELRAGIARLEAAGYEVVRGDTVVEGAPRRWYLAGDDEARAADLRRFLLDPSVAAVLCARGGYGSARALALLDLAELAAAGPKAFVGYSDLTYVLQTLTGRLGWVSFHGPQVAVDLGRDPDAPTLDSLLATLEGRRFPGPFQERPLTTLAPGACEGPVVGGCLSMLVTTLGTPVQVDLGGAVLFLEEIGEPAYRVDRMLTHLLEAGVLQGAAGVVLGHLKDVRAPAGVTVEEIVMDRLGPLGIPVAAGLEAGHGRPNRTLPIGVRCRLDADAGTLAILDEVVR